MVKSFTKDLFVQLVVPFCFYIEANVFRFRKNGVQSSFMIIEMKTQNLLVGFKLVKLLASHAMKDYFL